MPRRDASTMLCVALLTTTLLAGCSRLTFLKPDPSRGDYRQVAPDIDVSDARRSQEMAARDRLVIAQQRLRDGDLDRAEQHARAALDIHPRSAVAHTLLAVAAQRRGRDDDAGEHYARAAALEPERGATLNNYGTWLCNHGRAAQSLTWFDRALADPGYPTPADALANAGSCALKAGQGGRAQRDLRRAIELDPANAVALGALAEYAFGHGQAFEARAFSQRRLAAAPADADALRLASQIEDTLGDKAAAERYTQQLRAEFGEAVPARNGDNRSQ